MKGNIILNFDSKKGVGILTDGSVFMTERALSRFCGVEVDELIELVSNWSLVSMEDKHIKLTNSLKTFGFKNDSLTSVYYNDDTIMIVYGEDVCISVLEYYAFGVENPKDEITNRYRKLCSEKVSDEIIGWL